jgi:hypothetical protein
MSLRDRPYLLFLYLGLGSFVVAHIGFEIFARLWVERRPAWEAVRQSLYYAAIQPVGTASLLLPFLLLGWMAASLAKKRTLKSGAVLFVTGAVVLGLIYLAGHIGAEQAMKQRKWTAAALSVGLIPFYSTPVLFVMLFIRVLAGRKRS